MPLLVRNNEPNSTVFDMGSRLLRWAPAGDVMGDDVQRVPDSLAEDVDFIRSVERGVLAVEEGSPELLEKLAASSRSYGDRARRAEAAQQESVLDRRQDRDLVQSGCAECGAQVIQRAAERDQVAPLCNRHKDLRNQFSLEESGSVGDGGVRREWRRARVEHRVRSSTQ